MFVGQSSKQSKTHWLSMGQNNKVKFQCPLDKVKIQCLWDKTQNKVKIESSISSDIISTASFYTFEMTYNSMNSKGWVYSACCLQPRHIEQQ